jgi:hypothetical protein
MRPLREAGRRSTRVESFNLSVDDQLKVDLNSSEEVFVKLNGRLLFQSRVLATSFASKQ